MPKLSLTFLGIVAAIIVAYLVSVRFKAMDAAADPAAKNVAPTGVGELGNAYLTYNVLPGNNAAAVQAGIPTGDQALASNGELAQVYAPYLETMSAGAAQVLAAMSRSDATIPSVMLH